MLKVRYDIIASRQYEINPKHYPAGMTLKEMIDLDIGNMENTPDDFVSDPDEIKVRAIVTEGEFILNKIHPVVFSDRYTTIGTYTPEEILSISELFDIRNNTKISIDGFKVRMNSERYKVFSKSLKCAHCGIEGNVMLMQKATKDKSMTFHFNLYHRTSEGELILMTKDHIQPKALGGQDSLENYQTMCEPCNKKKGIEL